MKLKLNYGISINETNASLGFSILQESQGGDVSLGTRHSMQSKPWREQHKRLGYLIQFMVVATILALLAAAGGCNASRSLNDAISADESEICIFKCYSNHTPEAASNTTATKLQCICAPAFSNNSSAATNNFMNMNNFTLVLTSQ
ncbi:hypothetical protein TSUD_139260 [Trifolium subterraneum]|uniref:Uncharacterized protein n=1 Tax=Trifolium subterraneum TaxID=3900 RepID=A0A2Z6NQ56_TRISU|nr:hypothetical protein TSUD_139260 [Trifolium subterraneum]